MNLHAIAARSIAAVNPMVTGSVSISTGTTIAPDGTRTPTYAVVPGVTMQVQPVSTGDIRKLEGLNIRGVQRGIYLNGDWRGLVRPDGTGGDLITVSGRTWVVMAVLEAWPDWAKVAVTMQNV